MADSISNSHNIIDSRDVIKRLKELEDERDDFASIAGDRWDEEKKEHDASVEANDGMHSDEQGEFDDCCIATKWDRETYVADSVEEDFDDETEYQALEAFAEGAEGYSSDWNHGATLIRDSYFEEYARQFAEDIGAIPSDANWPCTCIDWEEAADQLKMDYTSVDFDGVDYWVR